MTTKQKRVLTYLFSGMIVGALASYTQSGLGILKSMSYVTVMLALLGIPISTGFYSRLRTSIVLVGCVIIGMGTSISLLLSPQLGTVSGVVQDMIYPLAFGLLLLTGYKINLVDRRFLASLVFLLSIVNGGVALLGALGIVKSVPLFGEIGTGRFVFGTALPSSTGLAYNVNYYATIQGSLFFLYGWLQQARKGSLERADLGRLMVIFILSL